MGFDEVLTVNSTAKAKDFNGLAVNLQDAERIVCGDCAMVAPEV
jgi:hypothetical protein